MIIVVAPARQQNTIHSKNKNDEDANTWLFMLNILDNLCLPLLPKYQPKRGGDLGWSKFFRFKCGIKNYLQIANVDLANV